MWEEGPVLTMASLGMLAYGIYSAGWAAADLMRGARLELWAELGLMVFGALLALALSDARPSPARRAHDSGRGTT